MGGKRPHVEIAAVIPDGQGKIVIGKRKGKTGTGLYELPGGNLDFGEDIFASIKREVLEETGLKIVPKKIIAYTNDIQKDEDKHEVTLYVLSEREDPAQQPETKEPHKIEGWEWKAWKEIAALGEAELFLSTLNLVRGEPDLDSKF
ncbi:putative nudix domain containing protein [Diaporthe ampelina]|uniref:Putative nudix domain containing protein n=1 Tax=Diaporthe ampelina TaxID=1214573 RepID=A0A0G2FF44_9PEZI|nr:putative nudix domain containing protein [Diaporthe ampelina]